MIQIGTSGFDYEDWRGFFYPDGLDRKHWLRYYAEHFSALELNFSYYRMPSAKQLASMVDRTGGKVDFAIKAHRTMTHERIAGQSDYAEFCEALAPLKEQNKLAAVLAQFPNSFRQSEENRVYIKRLADHIGPPLVIELRHAEWATDPILGWLKNLGVAYCCVDEPNIDGLMPPIEVATASPAYVRFHGRNGAKWYQHNHPAERYDYRYSPEELKPWANKIKRLHNSVGKVLVFFNNHFQSKAVDSAKMMERLLS